MKEEWYDATCGAEKVWSLSDVQEGFAGRESEGSHDWSQHVLLEDGGASHSVQVVSENRGKTTRGTGDCVGDARVAVPEAELGAAAVVVWQESVASRHAGE